MNNHFPDDVRSIKPEPMEEDDSSSSDAPLGGVMDEFVSEHDNLDDEIKEEVEEEHFQIAIPEQEDMSGEKRL